MTKKHFIALADAIRTFNAQRVALEHEFDYNQLIALAEFCRDQNPQFNRERWLAYIAGECGPNGGKL